MDPKTKDQLYATLKNGWHKYLAYRTWMRRHLIAITVGLCIISITGMVVGAQICAPDTAKFEARSYVL